MDTVHLQNTIDDTSVSHIKQPPNLFKKYCNPASWIDCYYIVTTNNIATWRDGGNTTIKYEVLQK